MKKIMKLIGPIGLPNLYENCLLLKKIQLGTPFLKVDFLYDHVQCKGT